MNPAKKKHGYGLLLLKKVWLNKRQTDRPRDFEEDMESVAAGNRKEKEAICCLLFLQSKQNERWKW